jgi:hypothetical protein
MSLVLAAVAVLLGASAFGKVAGFYVQRGRMQGVLTLAHSERDPNGLKQCLGEAKKTADTLKQNNLFIKTPPKENPVKQVEGILGCEAFIAGKWYKMGDKIADAKIVAINATDVKIEWNGKETSFSPIAAVSASPPAPPAGGPRKEAGPMPPKPAEVKVVKAEAPAPAPAEEDPLTWLDVKLSPRAREKALQKWNTMPPEQREKARQDWNNAPEEKKQQVIQELDGG